MAIARLASRQQGMVTWAQLRAAGVTRHSIAQHVTSGWLVKRHRGIYQLGVFPGPFGDEQAALLACRPACRAQPLVVGWGERGVPKGGPARGRLTPRSAWLAGDRASDRIEPPPSRRVT